MTEQRANLPEFINLTEKQKIEFWRYEYLTLWCHLDHKDASEIAASAMDVHELEDLLGVGCGLALAKRILAPLGT